jgi:hypothetical protein
MQTGHRRCGSTPGRRAEARARSSSVVPSATHRADRRGDRAFDGV